MKCYLVEAYSQDLKFKNDDYVVALTPFAAYELDKAGIKYTILEDYYDEAEFLKEEEAYFKDQLTWIDKFDNFLFDIFPDAKSKNLGLATSYYYYIKSMLDSLILRCKVINIFINKVRPNSIIYALTRWEEDSLSSAEHPLLFRKGQSLFSRLMPIFCEKYSIDFKRIILRRAADSNSIQPGFKSLMGRVKNSLTTNNYVRNLYHYYKTFSINSIFPESFKDHKHKLFFLKSPGFVKDIIKEVQKGGYGVYYKRDNDIIKQSFPRHKVVGRIYSNIISAPKCDMNDLPKEIETDILGWINDYCGINVSAIILPRMLYFINNFCPQLISLIDEYVAFYNDNQIDVVFTQHMLSVDEYAAIIAARYAEKTRSACLQHGDEVFALKMWELVNILPYHIYFAANDEKEEYIKHRIEFGNLGTKVFQYPNRYKILPKVNRPKRKRGSPAGQKTLVYVPTVYHWDNTFWNESRFTDTWYFSWHKELIKLFSSRGDFNFIWKGIPASNDLYDPIPNLINDRGYKNIKYVTEPFVKWIKKTDLVLLDYPATGLYEAAVSGLPVMSLYFAPFNAVRKSALDLFGKSLQSFNNFDEGILRIEKYLDSNLDEFIVSIPSSETSVVETLKHI
ncbi:MAG: hypothetical protein V3V70_03270 [Candidatus Scalindua sp.]